MRIAFHDIVGSECVRRITDSGWLPEGTKVTGPVEADIVCRRIGSERVDVTGSLRVTVAALCDRCCCVVDVPLHIDFLYRCVVGQETATADLDVECRDEDCYLLFMSEPVIDVDVLLCEQFYLMMPARVLCRHDCRGLCQHCGINRNDSSCNCQQHEKPAPFAVLQKLRKK